MKVYALVGESGTGKSYKAMEVVKNNDIDMIIDDGLLIWGIKVVAGSSAKKESTKIAAVKRALFIDSNHIQDAKNAIEEYRPKTILILGTSDGMVRRIQEALNLPKIEKTIYIRDISNKEEIEKARQSRIHEGKHVIPVPALEVKKFFSGYFLDPLKIFKKSPSNKRQEIQEKTVVRPTFSYLGNYTIADSVVKSVVHFIVSKVEGIHKVGRISIISNENGIIIELDATIKYGYVIPTTFEKVQSNIIKDLGYMTGQNILGVNIYGKGLYVEKDEG